MFEQVIAEKMKTSTKTNHRDDDCIDPSMKTVQFKPSFLDRVLPTLGDVMIRAGLKLKYRPRATLNTEQASAPNYLIML